MTVPTAGPGVPALALRSMALVFLSACQPSSPEGRRAAYLDCARSVGVPVERGTIRVRGADDMARLDACEAMPR